MLNFKSITLAGLGLLLTSQLYAQEGLIKQNLETKR